MVEEGDEDVFVEGSDNTSHESTRTKVAVLEAKVRLIAYMLKHDVVHRFQFEPVKMIAYGFAGIVISSVLVGVLSYIIKKGGV